MNAKILIDLFVKGGAKLQDITDTLQVVGLLLSRTTQYEEILVILEKVTLEDFPKIKEFVSLLHSAGLLTESGKTALIRECMSRSDELIVHTADPDLITITDAKTLVASSKIGLEVHQGQRVYKRSLDGDVSKLLK